MVATQQKQREIVSYRQLLTSPTNYDYVIDNPENVLTQTPIRMVVSKDSLTSEELAPFEDLESALGVGFNNLGCSIFDDLGVHQFVSTPIICLNMSGELVLSVGMYVKDLYTPIEIPLTFNGDHYYLGENKKHKLSMIPLKVGDNNIPLMVFKTSKYVHQFLVKHERESSYEHLEYAFETGNLSEYVTKLFSDSASFTKMFLPSFQQKTFPHEGILMVLEFIKMGKPFEDKVGTESSEWKIVSSSHDLPIQNSKKEITSLSNAGLLYCSATSEPTKIYKNKGSRKIYLYVRSQNQKRIDWTPEHVVFSDLLRIAPIVRNRFSKFLDEITATSLNASNANSNASGQNQGLEDVTSVSTSDIPENF